MNKLDSETLEKVMEVKRIRNLARTGGNEQAKKEIVAYLEKNPDDYYAYFAAGRIFENARCYDEAETFLLKVVESDNDNKYSAYGTLGRIYEAKGNLDEAIKYYKLAISGPFLETYSIRALSNIYIRQKRYEEAFEMLKLIKKSSPDYYNLEVGKIYTDLKEYAKAKKYLDRIEDNINLKGFDRKVLIQKVIVYRSLFDYEGALFQIEKILDEDVKDTIHYKALYEKANIYFSQKKYDEALETLKLCSKNNIKVAYLLGRINEIKGNISDAKKDYLVSVNSSNVNIKQESAYRLGDILLEERQYDKALANYLEAVKKRKAFPTYIYFRIVAVYMRMEKYKEAYKYLKIIEENDAEIVDDYLYREANTFLKSKLNIKIDKNTLCYRESMLVDYSYNKMFNHINYYTVDTKPKFINYTFDELYSIGKSGITPENKVETNLIDTYDLEVSEVGIFKGKTTDKLRVVTIPNTKKIIDMYPNYDETLKDKMKREKNKNKNKDQEKILVKRSF